LVTNVLLLVMVLHLACLAAVRNLKFVDLILLVEKYCLVVRVTLVNIAICISIVLVVPVPHLIGVAKILMAVIVVLALELKNAKTPELLPYVL
jgi:hypothetical protein